MTPPRTTPGQDGPEAADERPDRPDPDLDPRSHQAGAAATAQNPDATADPETGPTA